jgi:hypothetical protein
MVERLDLADFENHCGHFDEAIKAMEGIDHFCSSSDWIIPAYHAFHATHELFLYKLDQGYLPLARGFQPAVGRYLAPLEAMWGLASPIATAHPKEMIPALLDHVLSIQSEWDTLWFCGLNRHSPFFLSLATQFSAVFQVGLGPETLRHTASLHGGWNGYLGRRSTKFRTNLKRVLRGFESRGFETTYYADAMDPDAGEALYDRMVGIESRSWKGEADTGIKEESMNTFYRRMVRRLAQRGGLRALIATHEGVDVAFVFGGVQRGVFRGLQLSFDNAFRSHSLGNVMQGLMIQRLCEEGLHTYDLGTDLEYKRRWSEPGLQTDVIAFIKT